MEGQLRPTYDLDGSGIWNADTSMKSLTVLAMVHGVIVKF